LESDGGVVEAKLSSAVAHVVDEQLLSRFIAAELLWRLLIYFRNKYY